MLAVVFDWDLTLWDSWGIHLRLMENTAADLGVDAPSPEAVAAEFHRPFRQHLLWFFGSRPDAEDELERILESYLSRYDGILAFRNYLFPGVASLLPALKRRGIRIGILSDKIPQFGHPELQRSGLSALVDFADFKTDARPYKPAPDGLQTVLNGLSVAPEDAMYVGDGPQDVACARSVGAASGAALWSAIDRDATLEQQPNFRLHRPHQVLAAVARLRALSVPTRGSGTCRGPGVPTPTTRRMTRTWGAMPRLRAGANPTRPCGHPGRWRPNGEDAPGNWLSCRARPTRSPRCLCGLTAIPGIEPLSILRPEECFALFRL